MDDKTNRDSISFHDFIFSEIEKILNDVDSKHTLSAEERNKKALEWIEKNAKKYREDFNN